LPTHINLRTVTFYKLQDTSEVYGFEWDPAFIGKSFEQSHTRCTHNSAWIESKPCTGAVMSAGQLPR